MHLYFILDLSMLPCVRAHTLLRRSGVPTKCAFRVDRHLYISVQLGTDNGMKGFTGNILENATLFYHARDGGVLRRVRECVYTYRPGRLLRSLDVKRAGALKNRAIPLA